MQMSHKISGFTGPKFTKFIAIVIFLSAVLTQQSTLQSVHPLSNDRDIKKVTSLKHKPASGIAMPGGQKKLQLVCAAESLARDVLY